jgi:SHS2 domain-containing protein
VTVRLTLPQPWEEISHTADVGIAARGATPEEALARLVLALGALAAGGGPVEETAEDEFTVREGGDLAGTGVAAMREVLFRLASRGRIPCSCEVLSLRPGEARVRVGSGARDPVLHAEGADVKAVTWHQARLEPDGAGFRAQVILDV